MDDDEQIEVVQEPVDEWTAPVLSDDRSMLEVFYSNQQKNAFPFQMYALLSRYRQAVAMGDSAKYIVTERCMQSDFNIFGRSMWDTGKFDETEWHTYQTWFEELTKHPMVKSLNAVVYLRTSPDICMQRINHRMRHGESDKMKGAYVKHMHEVHERWIMNRLDGVRVLVLDGDLDGDDAVERHVQAILTFLSTV